jgi:hypothetical protein
MWGFYASTGLFGGNIFGKIRGITDDRARST